MYRFNASTGWCSDCPDHEACASGATCAQVRTIAVIRLADRDHLATIRRTAQQIDDEIRGGGRPEALIGDLLFLILGPEDRRRVTP